MMNTVPRPTIFVSSHCPSCRMLYGSPLISKADIRNIDSDAHARQAHAQAGLRVVPTMVHEGRSHVGVHEILNYLSRI